MKTSCWEFTFLCVSHVGWREVAILCQLHIYFKLRKFLSQSNPMQLQLGFVRKSSSSAPWNQFFKYQDSGGKSDTGADFPHLFRSRFWEQLELVEHTMILCENVSLDLMWHSDTRTYVCEKIIDFVPLGKRFFLLSSRLIDLHLIKQS